LLGWPLYSLLLSSSLHLLHPLPQLFGFSLLINPLLPSEAPQKCLSPLGGRKIGFAKSPNGTNWRKRRWVWQLRLWHFCIFTLKNKHIWWEGAKSHLKEVPNKGPKREGKAKIGKAEEVGKCFKERWWCF
jgi:hypothetical protein